MHANVCRVQHLVQCTSSWSRSTIVLVNKFYTNFLEDRMLEKNINAKFRKT